MWFLTNEMPSSEAAAQRFILISLSGAQLHTCVWLIGSPVRRCQSMTSAYLMLRSGLCPYVYVCCHQMTVLFRGDGVCRSQIHAVVTPTTRGIRAALDTDGQLYGHSLQ